MGTSNSSQVNVNIVGSSTFGLYPKISLEKTYNMFITTAGDDNQDKWLANYAGYQLVATILNNSNIEGRALYHSVRGNFLIAVVGNTVYKISPGLGVNPVLGGTLGTTAGEVFIDENLNYQICIVDGKNAWIYQYEAFGSIPVGFYQQTLSDGSNPIVPGYVSYHNTFFLIAANPAAIATINPQLWYVFQYNSGASGDFLDAITIVPAPGGIFTLQTKPDSALAVLRIPGRGNNVLVLGSTVAQIWNQVGGLQNYQRVSSININLGCLSTFTIAASEEFVCWLGQNENNSPTIVYSSGSGIEIISTDGIDSALQSIQVPSDSTAFFFRQDGHLFYQLTFFNPKDNLTLIYDFTTRLFFHGSDENLNFHPARQVVYFGNTTYFISLNDAALYAMGTEFVTYNYNINTSVLGSEIPRIRICKAIRKKDSSTFRVNMLTFWIEQGVNNYFEKTQAVTGYLNDMAPQVLLSFSKNGNQSFSRNVPRELNPQGVYRNQIRWHRLGQCNEITFQFRFVGFQRFVVNSAIAEIY